MQVAPRAAEASSTFLTPKVCEQIPLSPPPSPFRHARAVFVDVNSNRSKLTKISSSKTEQQQQLRFNERFRREEAKTWCRERPGSFCATLENRCTDRHSRMRLRVAGDFDFERDSWKSCRPSNILKVVAAVVDATSVVCFLSLFCSRVWVSIEVLFTSEIWTQAVSKPT